MIIIVLLNNLFFKIFIDIKTTSKMVENYKIIFFLILKNVIEMGSKPSYNTFLKQNLKPGT
jgi:hypothetical protein